MIQIAVFAYDFPHRKSYDFILEAKLAGLHPVVFGAPYKPLPAIDRTNYIDKTLRHASPPDTAETCAKLGVPFFPIDHDDYLGIGEIGKRMGIKGGIIAGARIIKRNVIELFPDGLVNFHPGQIPQTSGLDALFYTIKNLSRAGVTVHKIDHRVDAGELLFFEETKVGANDSLESLQENIYQSQIIALRKYLNMLLEGRINLSIIDRPKKNLPLTAVEKVACINQFPDWRATTVVRQNFDDLLECCRLGNTLGATAILKKYPDFINKANSHGWTPLIVSSFENHAETANALLSFGANPNLSGANGTTPLMYAKTKLLNCCDQNFDTIKVLIKWGADIHQTDRHGKTISHYIEEAGDANLFNSIKEIADAVH